MVPLENGLNNRKYRRIGTSGGTTRWYQHHTFAEPCFSTLNSTYDVLIPTCKRVSSVGEFRSESRSARTCLFSASPRTHVKKRGFFRKLLSELKKLGHKIGAEMTEFDRFRAETRQKNSFTSQKQDAQI